MKTTSPALRPSVAAPHPLPFAIAAVAVPVALILGGLALLRTPARPAPEAASVPGPRAVVVDGAAGSQLAAEHPWANAAPAALNPLSFVSVDGATAAQLAAAHPWVNTNVRPADRPLSLSGFVSVDGATASAMAAEHPWSNGGPAPVITLEPSLSRPPYAFVSVNSATASNLAAAHPWASSAP